LAVCVSIAFADATSAGQDVCAIPTVADSEIIVTIPKAAANILRIAPLLSDCVLTWVPAQLSLLWMPIQSDGCRWNATKPTFSKPYWFQQLGLTTNPLAPGPRQASLFEASNAMSPPGLPPEAPMDGAGTITAVGEGVKDFKPG
jgi:hypothetical protein